MSDMASLHHGKGGQGTARAHMGHARRHGLLAEVFFAGRRRRVYTELAILSGAQPGGCVLDVGCGDGYFTRVMAERVGPNGTAHGVDISPEAIKSAARLSRQANCSFSVGTAESLDPPEGSFDVVVSALMVHHLEEAARPRAIEEMSRVLRPGGHLLLAEFRPPATPLGKLLAAPFASQAMRHNPVQLLEPMVRDAGFVQTSTGRLRPWVYYVQATKPLAAA